MVRSNYHIMSFLRNYSSEYVQPEDMLVLVAMSLLQIMRRLPLAHHTYWMNIILIQFFIQVLKNQVLV